MKPSNNRTGILIVQLGTPDDASEKAVRRFLKEFLSDRHVIDCNRFLWFFILHFIILRKRPKQSAKLYQRYFNEHGRTLFTHTESLTQKIHDQLIPNQNILVKFGMRYGKPSFKEALDGMIQKENCSRVLVVPLFPQYSHTTIGSIIDACSSHMSHHHPNVPLHFLTPFYNHPGYIKCIIRLIEDNIQRQERPPERILFSYHGLPTRYVTQKNDPYHQMCLKTTEQLKLALAFPPERISHTYQSRFGKEPWLEPYTAETLRDLAKEGIRDVMVVCPGFVVDCLETLDEIGVENKNLFLTNGGRSLTLVSCLNDHNFWIEELTDLVKNELKDWQR